MSNTYLQFSEALVLKTDGERAWFKRYVDASFADDGHNWNEDGTPITEEAKFWKPVLDETDDTAALFDWDFEDLDGTPCVIFYSEEHGCVTHAARLVQHFFKEMRPEGKDGFAISWAETCDKMQPGQFGGGACFITKSEIHWLNTWQWIDELAQQLHVE